MDAHAHEYYLIPTVWTINVQCQGVPTITVRVIKDKTIAQFRESIIEQASEFDDDLRNIKFDIKVCELIQNNGTVKVVHTHSGNATHDVHCASPEHLENRAQHMSLSCGDHVCWMIGNEKDGGTELQVLANFVIEGIQLHHKVLCMIAGDDDVAYAHSPITHEGLAHTLAARGFATEKFSSSGQLVILGAETVGFSEDFIPEQMIARLRVTAQEAMEQGFKALRIAGDRYWTFSKTGEDGRPAMSESMRSKVMKYELEINSVIEENPFIISLCMYDRRNFSENSLLEVLKVHPRAAVSHETFDNFYYIPPEKTSHGYTHWMSNLEAHKRVDIEVKKKMKEITKINQMMKREVEQRTRAEHEMELLALAHKQRSQFIAQMSHEIRSPLNGIMASGSLLSHTPLHKEHQEIVETIEASTRQLLLILTKVLDPSPAPSPSPSLSPAPSLSTSPSPSHSYFPLFTLPNLQDSDPLLPSHSPAYSSSSPAYPISPPRASSPPSSTSPPPLPSFGITPERRNMIHSRSSPDVSTSPSHTSLSFSSPPDLHTTFTSPFTEVSKQFPRLLHVLIVDDSVINKRVLERMLVRLDRVVCESVMNGKQAVDLCAHRHFDVILMDLFMPVMNGLEATREINNICRTRRRKPVVVAVTASVTEEIRKECLEDLGMAEFITKPINVSVFLQMFTNILPKLSE